ncbi:MAG: phage integrase SAM-like domain-containing protein [Moheibacter sp.]
MNEIIKHNIQPPVYGKMRFKFLAIVRQFITAAINGEILTPNGDKYSKGTIRTYLTFMLTIEAYEKEFGTIYTDDINILWAEYYRMFLTNMNLSKNSIAANMSKLKAIINRAYIAGIMERSAYGIKISQERTVQVYLTLSDLKKLYYFEFGNPGETKTRDVFIMHCFIGMRISDYLKFIRSPKDYIIEVDDNQFIEYFSTKTGIKSVVPIHRMVKIILRKNNFDFGAKFSYQHYNNYLKKICKKAGITELVRTIQTIGGVRVEKEVPKYKLVSSHTARRTFASLAELAKINRPAIMKITGHKTEAAFMSYIRISELDSALTIFDHDFFKIEL